MQEECDIYYPEIIHDLVILLSKTITIHCLPSYRTWIVGQFVIVKYEVVRL